MSSIINFFGGPGCGKSTVANELFSIMKKNNFSVEITYEYPKIMAWENNFSSIKDQFFITANQHRNITRLYNKVDYIIVDSPILLGCVYKNKYATDDEYPTKFYSKLDVFILDLFKQYHNINIFLNRNNGFNKIGRFQNSEESKEIDKEIKQLLLSNNLYFYELAVDNNTAQNIFDKIKNHG